MSSPSGCLPGGSLAVIPGCSRRRDGESMMLVMVSGTLQRHVLRCDASRKFLRRRPKACFRGRLFALSLISGHFGRTVRRYLGDPGAIVGLGRREVIGIWMAVGYRSIFSLQRGHDVVRLTAEQFRSWLALKGYGLVAIAPGVHEVAEHAQLVVTELHPHDGSRSLRYRLTESSSAGEWVTTVTVHRDGREDDWVWVDVNAPPTR